jgi:thiamine-phosphate pyrophosphorylase
VPDSSKFRASANRPLLCYVTDSQTLVPGPSTETLPALLQKIATIATAGVDWIQIREKQISVAQLSSLTRQALGIAKENNRTTASQTESSPATCILINDRLDVALAENAGGVHLGEDSLPVKEAKQLPRSLSAPPTNSDFLVGVSCHSISSARQAANDGADYIFFGPIFATPSKAAYGPPQGLQRLSEVCAAIPVPVLAIGGITVANAASCLTVGAAGIAAIRLFQDSSGIDETVNVLRSIRL